MNKKVILGSIAGVILLTSSVLSINASSNHNQYVELQDKLATLNVEDYSENNALVKNETLLNMDELYASTYDDYNTKLTKLSDILLAYDYTLNLNQKFTNLDDVKSYLSSFFEENLDSIANTIYEEDIDISSLNFNDEVVNQYIALVDSEVETKKLEQVAAVDKVTEGSNEPSVNDEINNNNGSDVAYDYTSDTNSSNNNSNSNNNTGSSNNNNSSGGDIGEITDGTDYDNTCGTLTGDEAYKIMQSLGYDPDTTDNGFREWVDPSGCLSWSQEWEDGTYIDVSDTGYWEIYYPGSWVPDETGWA